MVGPIRSHGIAGPAAIGGLGSPPSGNRTGGALRRLAGRVAKQVAREFRLFDDQDARDERPAQYREGEDLYDISGTSRELAAQLGGRPLDEGLLARSLDGFVQESAVLLAARPGAASLDAIARVILANEGPREEETLARSIAQIDQTARGIAAVVPDRDPPGSPPRLR